MACSVCGSDGHNAATCPDARRCSYCGKAGHNVQTCSDARRCSACGKAGHNVSTCTNVNRCSNCNQPGHNAATCPEPTVHPLEKAVDRIADIPVPLGRKLEYFHVNDGWLNTELESAAWKERADGVLAALRTYEMLRPAFKNLVKVVHKASKHTLYVGRAGSHPDHLWARFCDHRDNRKALYIKPVLRMPTEQAKDGRWETIAIRWLMRQAENDVLCCNNTAAGHCGSWPSTDDTVIYVVVCSG